MCVNCERKGMLVSQKSLLMIAKVMEGNIADIEFTLHRQLALFLVDIAKDDTTLEGFQEMAQATADNAVALIREKFLDSDDISPVKAVH